MKRRDFLSQASALTALAAAGAPFLSIGAARAAAPRHTARVRPGDQGWPTPDQWESLRRAVGGRLHPVADPLEACRRAPGSTEAARVVADMANPFYVQEQAGGTETAGWVDAWTPTLPAQAVHVTCAADVAAAVDFARTHHLRLVVKGGAHSYLGQSCAPDSLLVWMHGFDRVEMKPDFVPRGAPAGTAGVEAVTVEAGAVWLQVYDRVVVQGGRYVQGGGCTSVGVAGHLQTGGFGSFSKRFGMSAAGILELELVTSDGQVRTVNRFRDPDLLWAWKGAGAAFGIATRVTLRTQALPETFGTASGVIAAHSDAAFEALVSAFMRLYRDGLMNPHWGEQITLDDRRRLTLSLAFQGLSAGDAERALQPLREMVSAQGEALSWETPLRVMAIPARQMWDYNRLSHAEPRPIIDDHRPGAPAGRYWWKGDGDQVCAFFSGYESGWLHQRLLEDEARPHLVQALLEAARRFPVSLHFNKGLAGAPPQAAEEVREGLCINPVAADAFALVIIAGGQSRRWRGVANLEPDLTRLRRQAADIKAAMDALREVAPDAGGYASEMSYHASDWREAAWGPHYPRLLAIKQRVDPCGLFVGHHYVGSDQWSADGFTPRR